MFLILVNTGATLRDRLFKKTVGITRHKGSELQKKKNWCWQTQRFVQLESTNKSSKY
jgi:hypothetical protein